MSSSMPQQFIPNLAMAEEIFEHFCAATTMRQILGLYRNMCDEIGLRPGPFNEFYPKLKTYVKKWKAQALWKKFDFRAMSKVYNKGTACSGIRVLIIGAGPCGLRTAIEAQLLGCKVVVVEMRDRMSRNNVLHLWPFVITDLRNLGAKKFYGKFCAGSIDHISIRQLQCILLKVALLLGVEIHEGVRYIKTIEPQDGLGWRASVVPEDHAVSHYEFDVLIGADGKRNTLEGFRRKEFRGKLAIAITANFINKRTEAEAQVEEISGIAFIFNQSFFKELYKTTGVDLENIVYYKDDTHYFVMTAKKHSLIDKGVIMQDHPDPALLLNSSNVNTARLLDYAREAANFSTKYQMPHLEYAVNHYGKPDIAMFDFTSMFAAVNSSQITVRQNYRLLTCLVGDSLLEPFWPTGSGCARGFLSSMDAAYAIKLFANPNNSLLGVLAQRETVYRLLGQTTPENLQRDITSYTLDPATRYMNLNQRLVRPVEMKDLLDTDDPELLEQIFVETEIMDLEQQVPRRKRRTALEPSVQLSQILLRWIRSQLQSYSFVEYLHEIAQCFTSGKVLLALINRYRPELVDLTVLEKCENSPLDCNKMAFAIMAQHYNIQPIMSAEQSLTLLGMEQKVWLTYLEQVCEVFRGLIPHMDHPKLDFDEFKENARVEKLNRIPMKIQHYPPTKMKMSVPDFKRAKKRRNLENLPNIDGDNIGQAINSRIVSKDSDFHTRIKNVENMYSGIRNDITEKKPKDLMRAIGKIESSDWNVREIERKIELQNVPEVGTYREKVPKWNREQFLDRQRKVTNRNPKQGANPLDDIIGQSSALNTGERGKNKVAALAGQFSKRKSEEAPDSVEKRRVKPNAPNSNSDECYLCKDKVYLMEKIPVEGKVMHRSCLKCVHCNSQLRLGGYAFDKGNPNGEFYCKQHFRLPPKGSSSSRMTRRHEMEQRNKKRSSGVPSGNAAAPVAPIEVNMRATEDVIAMHHLMERGQTPERIEFENVDAIADSNRGDYYEEQQEIDENEWTDRNFGTETEESESDFYSTESTSDTDSDDSDIYEEATDSPLGAQTLQLANEWIGKQKHSMRESDEDDFYDSSDEDDADSQTEGEDQVRAREIRMQEVKLMPPVYTATDTETEVQSDTESSSPEEREHNSATEISTDSEFDHDSRPGHMSHNYNHRRPQRTPTVLRQKVNDNTLFRSKTTTAVIPQKLTEKEQNRLNRNNYELGLELNIQPLVQVDPSVLNCSRTPLKNPRPGDYLLNKVASTEGMASKKSLELKKRYLLGEPMSTGIIKSESSSVLDSKFKSFHSNITECQRLLNAKPTIDRETDYVNNPVYGQINNVKLSDDAKNVVGDPELPKTDILETINLSLITKRAPIGREAQQTVSLSTITGFIQPKSDSVSSSTPIIDLTKTRPISSTLGKQRNDDHEVEVIDLTGDSPDEDNDRTIHNGVIKSEQVVPDVSKAEKTVNETERPGSQNNEMTISKTIPGNTPEKRDLDSDSLSSSSSTTSSSMKDIPHFILDSATSPDTQHLNSQSFPIDAVAPKGKSVRNNGELMQIDSLMIVDGKYVGDPEDLKLLEKLPEGTIIETETEIKFARKDLGLIGANNAKNNLNNNHPQPNINRPHLKFDTKNENKVDTLKNLPLTPTRAVAKDILKTDGKNGNAPADGSDSETDLTGQVFTETELSDWAADDAVSENFVDLEFALNSNKGTIKRNKKAKSKNKVALKSDEKCEEIGTGDGGEHREKEVNVEKKTECNIMKNLGVENIEFMDTGSDESCAETYSTTNKAMLKNRGYVEFVEPEAKPPTVSLFRNSSNVSSLAPNKVNYEASKELPVKEIPGIDFVEQGACILSNDYNELKTPVNEMPTTLFSNMSLKFSGMTARLSSNESLNDDIEQDSLLIVDNVKEMPRKSEAILGDMNHVEKPRKRASKENLLLDDGQTKNGDEITYEEYVRQLQNKITQISNARDSLDIRKGKRKTSKGDLTVTTVIAPDVPVQEKQSPVLSIFDGKITQPPTLTKKLEELTKERTKQKDLIHDLVMDKLQTKKQLNAEKRLNRSRNRQIGSLSPALPTTPLSQVPKVPTTASEDKEDGNSLATKNRASPPPPLPEKGVNKENLPFNKFPSMSTPKITKTQSFCVYSSRVPSTPLTAYQQRTHQVDDNFVFATPVRTDLVPSNPDTEKMRSEARARAKLKTNEELGLSPDEKILQLRRRYHLEKQQQQQGSPYLEFLAGGTNKSDDVKAKEKMLMTSKSVNDVRNEKLLMDNGCLLATSMNSKEQGALLGTSGLENGDHKKVENFKSDPNLVEKNDKVESKPRRGGRHKDPERRKSLIQAVSDFFHKRKETTSGGSPPLATNAGNTSQSNMATMASGAKEKMDTIFNRFKISPNKARDKASKEKSYGERSKSENCLKMDSIANGAGSQMVNSVSIGGTRNAELNTLLAAAGTPASRSQPLDEECPPPVPPLPLNYQRSDDESYSNDRELKKMKALSKASRQGELKRLRIAQEIQREQEEIEVEIKDLETRGVQIEKALRGEDPNLDMGNVGANDEKLLKDLLEIWRNITHLKKRDEELSIRQQELQLEHRHAQLKEQLNMRLSTSKLDKSSADVAAEGAILNEMLEIVAKRAALRPTDTMAADGGVGCGAGVGGSSFGDGLEDILLDQLNQQEP